MELPKGNLLGEDLDHQAHLEEMEANLKSLKNPKNQVSLQAKEVMEIQQVGLQVKEVMKTLAFPDLHKMEVVINLLNQEAVEMLCNTESVNQKEPVIWANT